MTEALTISRAVARRFLAIRHFLAPPRSLPAEPASVMTLIDRIASLQFDPLEVAGRNHDGYRLELATDDPLIWDRDFLRRCYDFDYVWEVYVPAPRRRWGYYVLPILFGDRLVGSSRGHPQDRRGVVGGRLRSEGRRALRAGVSRGDRGSPAIRWGAPGALPRTARLRPIAARSASDWQWAGAEASLSRSLR